jgi:hypothetical protein
VDFIALFTSQRFVFQASSVQVVLFEAKTRALNSDRSFDELGKLGPPNPRPEKENEADSAGRKEIVRGKNISKD